MLTKLHGVLKGEEPPLLKLGGVTATWVGSERSWGQYWGCSHHLHSIYYLKRTGHCLVSFQMTGLKAEAEHSRAKPGEPDMFFHPSKQCTSTALV